MESKNNRSPSGFELWPTPNLHQLMKNIKRIRERRKNENAMPFEAASDASVDIGIGESPASPRLAAVHGRQLHEVTLEDLTAEFRALSVEQLREHDKEIKRKALKGITPRTHESSPSSSLTTKQTTATAATSSLPWRQFTSEGLKAELHLPEPNSRIFDVFWDAVAKKSNQTDSTSPTDTKELLDNVTRTESPSAPGSEEEEDSDQMDCGGPKPSSKMAWAILASQPKPAETPSPASYCLPPLAQYTTATIAHHPMQGAPLFQRQLHAQPQQAKQERQKQVQTPVSWASIAAASSPALGRQQQQQQQQVQRPVSWAFIASETSTPVDKQTLGERLYPQVYSLCPTHAGKVTGMLLEMDSEYLLQLMHFPPDLKGKIEEAVAILRAHLQTQALKAPGSSGVQNDPAEAALLKPVSSPKAAAARADGDATSGAAGSRGAAASFAASLLTSTTAEDEEEWVKPAARVTPRIRGVPPVTTRAADVIVFPARSAFAVSSREIERDDVTSEDRSLPPGPPVLWAAIEAEIVESGTDPTAERKGNSRAIFASGFEKDCKTSARDRPAGHELDAVEKFTNTPTTDATVATAVGFSRGAQTEHDDNTNFQLARAANNAGDAQARPGTGSFGSPIRAGIITHADTADVDTGTIAKAQEMLKEQAEELQRLALKEEAERQESQRKVLSSLLFPLVERLVLDPSWALSITSLLLQRLDTSQLQLMLQSQEVLVARVREAYAMLQNQQQAAYHQHLQEQQLAQRIQYLQLAQQLEIQQHQDQMRLYQQSLVMQQDPGAQQQLAHGLQQQELHTQLDPWQLQIHQQLQVRRQQLAQQTQLCQQTSQLQQTALLRQPDQHFPADSDLKAGQQALTVERDRERGNAEQTQARQAHETQTEQTQASPEERETAEQQTTNQEQDSLLAQKKLLEQSQLAQQLYQSQIQFRPGQLFFQQLQQDQQMQQIQLLQLAHEQRQQQYQQMMVMQAAAQFFQQQAHDSDLLLSAGITQQSRSQETGQRSEVTEKEDTITDREDTITDREDTITDREDAFAEREEVFGERQNSDPVADAVKQAELSQTVVDSHCFGFTERGHWNQLELARKQAEIENARKEPAGERIQRLPLAEQLLQLRSPQDIKDGMKATAGRQADPQHIHGYQHVAEQLFLAQLAQQNMEARRMYLAQIALPKVDEEQLLLDDDQLLLNQTH